MYDESFGKYPTGNGILWTTIVSIGERNPLVFGTGAHRGNDLIASTPDHSRWSNSVLLGWTLDADGFVTRRSTEVVRHSQNWWVALLTKRKQIVRTRTDLLSCPRHFFTPVCKIIWYPAVFGKRMRFAYAEWTLRSGNEKKYDYIGQLLQSANKSATRIKPNTSSNKSSVLLPSSSCIVFTFNDSVLNILSRSKVFIWKT